jgi:hypothetical protein
LRYQQQPIARDTNIYPSGDLTHEERLDYVNAVLCLQLLPPRTPANVSAGARSRVSIAHNHDMTTETRMQSNILPHSTTTSSSLISSRLWTFTLPATSCHGTGTRLEADIQDDIYETKLIFMLHTVVGSRILTRRHFEMSADTKATSP